MTLYFVQDGELSLFVRADLGAHALGLWRDYFGLRETDVPHRVFAFQDDAALPGAIPWNCPNGIQLVREWIDCDVRHAA